MGRDLGIFPHILRALHLSGPKAEPEFAEKSHVEILYPTDFIPKDSPDQEQAMEDLIEDMVESSGCAYRKISIKEDWRKTSSVGEKDLQQYLYNVG
jgi:neutral trehalase